MKIITRAEAIKNGLPSYFTGKPCKYGHISKRGVLGGNCYKCDYEHGIVRRNAIKQQRAIARGEA